MDGVVQVSAGPTEDVRNGRDRGSGTGTRTDRICCELDHKGDRLVHEFSRLEEAVGEAELVRLAAVEHPVLAQRVLDDEGDRGLGPDEARDELRPSPARNDAEQALGAGKVANRGRDGARVAMERELDPAAQAGPVDCGDGGVRQRSHTAEELMSGSAVLARELREAAQREFLEIGSRGEKVRLAGDHQRGPLIGLELAQDLLEGLERGTPEDRRLHVVGAVVDRHEGDRPFELGLDHLRELELRQRQRAPFTMKH